MRSGSADDAEHEPPLAEYLHRRGEAGERNGVTCRQVRRADGDARRLGHLTQRAAHRAHFLARPPLTQPDAPEPELLGGTSLRERRPRIVEDRKSTRLNSSHVKIS